MTDMTHRKALVEDLQEGLQFLTPCTGGWFPIPLPGEDPPAPDPIELLKSYSTALATSAVQIYDNESQPNNVEVSLTGVLENGQIQLRGKVISNDSSSVKANFFMGTSINVLFVWHTHVTRSENLANRGTFSPGDIEMLRNVKALKQDFVSFADCRNKRYAFVITDIAKAKAFFAATTREDILYNYTTTGSGNTQEVDERCVKNVIGSAATNGISFYVSTDSPNFQSWTLLNP
jgi:hypothetical protein